MGAIELVEVFMSLPAAVACVLVSLFRFSLHFPPFSAFSAFPALFTLFTRMPLATIQPLQKPIETTQKLSGTQELRPHPQTTAGVFITALHLINICVKFFLPCLFSAECVCSSRCSPFL